MGKSYFGKAACGNSELVSRLERGRTVTLATAERVNAFMATRLSMHVVKSAQVARAVMGAGAGREDCMAGCDRDAQETLLQTACQFTGNEREVLP